MLTKYLALTLPCFSAALAALMVFWRRGRPSELKSLPSLLGFVVVGCLAGSVMFMLGGRDNYVRLYWVISFIDAILLLAVAMELIWCLLPKRFAIWWAALLFLPLGVAVGASMPLTSREGYLWVLIAADLTAGAILCGMVFFSNLEWTSELGWDTAGVVLLLVGTAWPSLRWVTKVDWITPLVCELGPLAGMVAFVVAAKQEKRD